jgi:hypothetical protein
MIFREQNLVKKNEKKNQYAIVFYTINICFSFSGI